MVGSHPVCSLLQPLMHAAFGKFMDAYLRGETAVESGNLANEIVGAMAKHLWMCQKVQRPGKGRSQTEHGRSLCHVF